MPQKVRKHVELIRLMTDPLMFKLTMDHTIFIKKHSLMDEITCSKMFQPER